MYKLLKDVPEREIILYRVRYVLTQSNIMKEHIDDIMNYVNDQKKGCVIMTCDKESLVGMNYCFWHKCHERLCPNKEDRHPKLNAVFRCKSHWGDYIYRDSQNICAYESCVAPANVKKGYTYCRIHTCKLKGCKEFASDPFLFSPTGQVGEMGNLEQVVVPEDWVV